MNLGDSLAQNALTTGHRSTVKPATGEVRLAITLPDSGVQHFARPLSGGPGDWRATNLESPGGGCVFDEPITAQWGRGLNVLAP